MLQQQVVLNLAKVQYTTQKYKHRKHRMQSANLIMQHSCCHRQSRGPLIHTHLLIKIQIQIQIQTHIHIRIILLVEAKKKKAKSTDAVSSTAVACNRQ